MSQSKSPQVFRWSKSVDESECEFWETELTVEGVSFVSEKLVKRQRWKFMVYDPDRSVCEGLKEKFGGGVTEIHDQDWKPAAEDGQGVIRIRDRFLVTESGDEKFVQELRSENPNREVLSFPPQLAFGTGFHPTTAGCLRLLTDASRDIETEGWRMLDIGCGSGILAIAAEKQKAGDILAIELDEVALDIARINGERHDCQNVEWMAEDAIDWLDRTDFSARGDQYEIVAANLFSSLLIAMMPNLPRCVAPGGTVILSGFLTSQTKEVFESAKSVGIHLDQFLRRGKWVAASGKVVA